jgi:hypothetical protein
MFEVHSDSNRNRRYITLAGLLDGVERITKEAGYDAESVDNVEEADRRLDALREQSKPGS